MEKSDLWDKTESLVRCCRPFERTFWLHRQRFNVHHSSPSKKEVNYSLESLITTSNATQWRIPDDGIVDRTCTE